MKAGRRAMFALGVLVWGVLVVAHGARADDKKADGKKEEKKGEDPFAELFGDSLDDRPQRDLRDITKGIGEKKAATGLTPKADAVDENAKVELARVFAAKRIRIHKDRGCEPADAERTRISDITVDALPARVQAFSVCLTLNSRAGREMRVATAVVDAKNRKVARAESVVSFRGKPVIDHVMEFPPVELKESGTYSYAIDVEGKEAGRLPLFLVKVETPPEQ
jgi:hypothetical protein